MREFIVELVAADTYVFIAAGSNVAHMIQEVSKDATVIVASLEVLEFSWRHGYDSATARQRHRIVNARRRADHEAADVSA